MTQPEFKITNNLTEMDLGAIYQFLTTESVWARGIPWNIFQKSLAHSLCFGGLLGTEQVAFARVISDYATFAKLVDVFVLTPYRRRGYAKMLMQSVVDHPQLQGLRRFTLATKDAHRLYRKFGFTALSNPESFMERYFPGIYTNQIE